jgi:Nif-specific regulatory protein
MHRGALVLLDESTGRLRTEAAIGMTQEEIDRGKYALGEGITGNVVATGRPRLIADLREEPDFLNRTGRISNFPVDTAVSFLCVPIKIEGRTAGALSVDKQFTTHEQLLNDQAFLDIIAAFLAQAIQINRMVMRQKEELLEENAQLRAQVRDRYRFENIIGDSPAMHEVFAVVGQVANSRATVLLLGETGTGKEMIAKAIHYNSPRKDKPFVRVNCGALTGTLLESELFGHVKGSFTGAIRDKIGRFEAADGGTIFLDEIGDLLLETQITLLRVLQEREIERIGSSSPIPVDVRVIAATHRDIEAAVLSGEFREDLYYRLNVVPILNPPLRERTDDIPVLVEFLVAQYAKRLRKTLRTIETRTMTLLQEYNWPGNVRELQNVVERAVVLCEGDTFTVDESWLRGTSVRKAGRVRSSTPTLAESEREQILSALESAAGKISGPGGAAQRLGIPRQTLESKMKALAIDPASFRKS